MTITEIYDIGAYCSPKVDFTDITIEGVLCASVENHSTHEAYEEYELYEWEK